MLASSISLHALPFPFTRPTARVLLFDLPDLRLAAARAHYPVYPLMLLRVLVCVFFALAFPLTHAHGPLESTVSILHSEEDYEVTAELTLASAARLLPPTEAANFSAHTFAEHHGSLLAATPRLLSLIDVAGQPIPPSRCLASLNSLGEVRVTFLYPASLRPASLRFDLLSLLPPGQFCLLSDQTTTPPQRVVLLRETLTHVFTAAPAL